MTAEQFAQARHHARELVEAIDLLRALPDNIEDDGDGYYLDTRNLDCALERVRAAEKFLRAIGATTGAAA